jgi:hypothetical protein
MMNWGVSNDFDVIQRDVFDTIVRNIISSETLKFRFVKIQ